MKPTIAGTSLRTADAGCGAVCAAGAGVRGTELQAAAMAATMITWLVMENKGNPASASPGHHQGEAFLVST